MNTSTNIFLAITNKPLLAFGITQSAFVTSLLAWVGVITPIVGLIAAVFGLAIKRPFTLTPRQTFIAIGSSRLSDSPDATLQSARLP